MLKKCEHCGGHFNAARINIKYCCRSCRDKAYRERQKSPYNEKREKKMDRICEINEKARAEGLSYGQYVGKLWLEEQKRRKK